MLIIKEANNVAGFRLSFKTYAFYCNPPLSIHINMGYDRPTNRDFLYIESYHEDFTSPKEIDGCIYNSMQDPFLGSPEVIRYLDIFKKYQIYIPIRIYEILQDIIYCHPEGKTGYIGIYEDNVSFQAHALYGDDIQSYYYEFEKLIYGLDYDDPLNEQDGNSAENMSDTSLAPLLENQQQRVKNRLTLGEGDFSFAAALCRKHPEITGKIIVSEYREEHELEDVYKTIDVARLKNIKDKDITIFSRKTILLVGEDKELLDAYFMEHGRLYKHNKQTPKTVKISLTETQESLLTIDPKTKLVNRTSENNEVLDDLLDDIVPKILGKKYEKSFHSHKSFLMSRGVEMHYGIDAQLLEQHFTGQRFQKIHFNCPHMPGSARSRELPKMLANFFKSASAVQYIGDKIYMALPEPINIEDRKNRVSYIYKVYDAAAESGYKLIKKRNFDDNRYPGYVHKMTGKAVSAQVANQIREYIFRRIEPQQDLPDTIHYKSPTELREHYPDTKDYDTGHVLPEMMTDDDSSTYSFSENDDELCLLDEQDDQEGRTEYPSLKQAHTFFKTTHISDAKEEILEKMNFTIKD